MYYPNERPDYRVFDTLEGSVLWSGADRIAAVKKFESSAEALVKQKIRTYLILQALDERGLYRIMKERRL